MNQLSHSPAPTFTATTVDEPTKHPRVAIIASSWHREIVDKGKDSLLHELERCGVPASHIEQMNVPGAFEIPLFAKKLAQSGRYDAIIACGLVVNGGIYRHEFVASAVIDGLMRVQLDAGVPVLSAVLTPQNFHEHEDHVRFFSEHLIKKGVEVARACLAAVAGLASIEAMGTRNQVSRATVS
ncbi:MAG: 6,7-dimethyl-8-ribityllumazine synthase [Pseudomonadota bacterium]